MAYELREGQGSLFRNENRNNDKAPHARGEALIGGVVYEIAAWTKEGRKGKFQSLSIKPKEQRRDQPQQRQTSYSEASGGRDPGFLDDEIDF